MRMGAVCGGGRCVWSICIEEMHIRGGKRCKVTTPSE